MNRPQLLLVIACVLSVVLLYYFGQRQKTIDPNAAPNPNAPFANAQGGDREAMAAAMANQKVDIPLVGIDIERITNNVKQKLTPAQRDKISNLEKQLDNKADKATQAKIAQQLAEAWEKENYIEIAAYYYKRLAEADSTADNWQKAGDQLSLGFKVASDSVMSAYLLQNAVKSYEKTLQIDSTRTDATINLAACYIEGYTTQAPLVMKGVFLLRGVTAKDSTNAAAYLILGKAAITSGQYDRAVERLERATRYDPQNAEAYYFLAEAYGATGNKEKSIKALQECKKLTKNPTFARELDQIILNLQKP
jgi:tetratricopeptide (TPR) repeat protein